MGYSISQWLQRNASQYCGALVFLCRPTYPTPTIPSILMHKEVFFTRGGIPRKGLTAQWLSSVRQFVQR